MSRRKANTSTIKSRRMNPPLHRAVLEPQPAREDAPRTTLRALRAVYLPERVIEPGETFTMNSREAERMIAAGEARLA